MMKRTVIMFIFLIMTISWFNTIAAQVIPGIERFSDNPIITPEMLPGDDGDNINGPALIEVPDWAENPLGKYYLYFSHHIGSYIRLAYADDLAGPWTVHEPGTLQLKDTICNDFDETASADYKHVASPDVHVNAGTQKIRMYFHCPAYISGSRDSEDSYKQVTIVATSSDGVSFQANEEPLGNSYFRVFEWGDYYYALGMPGIFYRSRDGLTMFEQGPTLFTQDMRHTAVKVANGKLLVFYTVVGENPERILISEVELGSDWMQWSATEPQVVLEPELEWEGANLPHEPSVRGDAMGPVRQLRDPALFERQGHSYLLYSVAGESGIAISEIDWSGPR